MKITENQQWLLKHSAVYDRRAWWLLAISIALLLATPFAMALLIPAVHIRIQVSRMTRYARDEQGANEP